MRPCGKRGPLIGVIETLRAYTSVQVCGPFEQAGHRLQLCMRSCPRTGGARAFHVPADLSINEDGFLIDTKTGKVINEFGATRFDVAVRALRDELSPPEWVEVGELHVSTGVAV